MLHRHVTEFLYLLRWLATYIRATREPLRWAVLCCIAFISIFMITVYIPWAQEDHFKFLSDRTFH